MTLHTDIPTLSELERLLAARESASISIYLPTSPLTQEAQASRIDLKSLAGEAARQLEASGADRRSAADVRESLDELVDDEDFWEMQAQRAWRCSPRRAACGRSGCRTGSRAPSRLRIAST